MQINIEGLTETCVKFSEMPLKARALNERALRESAEIEKEAISFYAPKSKNHSLSGPKHKGKPRRTPPQHMANAVPIHSIKVKGDIQQIDVGWHLNDNSLYVYAKWVNWGTSKMPARNFIKEAKEQTQGEISTVFKNTWAEIGDD